MIKDIYIRPPSNPNYDSEKMETSDEMEMLYSKIVMLLGTRAGEVLGDPLCGINLEDKLFTFNLDESAIRDAIFSQIQKYIPEAGRFKLRLEVKRFRGTTRDLILLDFHVNGRKAFGVMVK